MSTAAIGALAGAVACVAASPYLARLTLAVPDRADEHWWRGQPATRTRLLVTTAAALGLGALSGAAAGWSALFPAFLVLALTGTALTIIDFEHHRLPDRLLLPAAFGALVLLAVAAAVWDDWSSYLRAIEGAAAVFAALFLLLLLSPRGIGYGDVKLGGVLGAYLGWHSWAAVYFGLFAGFLLGASVAVVLLAARRASLKTALAFGPMLLLGALLVLAFNITPSLVPAS